jgi:uncharacterized protein
MAHRGIIILDMNVLAQLFNVEVPIIGCLHLMALPGAPRYGGSMSVIYDKAIEEAGILLECGIDGLIIENFRDTPYYPKRVPVETAAALSAVARDLKRHVACPIGLNVLRNDGEAALAIATAVGASFIRVNIHCGAVVSEQGIIEGAAHETLRLRSALRSGVLIFADIAVKHARPLVDRGLVTETKDVIERGCADAVIVSGERTGSETPAKVVQEVRRATEAPLIIGSGATPENIGAIFSSVNGMIVGSYFKTSGNADNFVERSRAKAFMTEVYKLRNRNTDVRPTAASMS